MKKKFFFIFLFISLSSQAQKRDRSIELGGFAGVSYYTGELNPQGQFKFVHPALGIIFRRNYNSRFSFKSNLFYGNVSGSDAQAGVSTFEKNRDLSFSSMLLELSQQVEFTFYPFKVMDLNPYYSPYVFAGVSAFYFNPKSSSGNNLRSQSNEGVKYSPVAAAFPFGAGMKLKFSHRFMMGMEWGLRRTFTDYLDDVSSVNLKGYQRGDSKSKDWYSFAGISITVRIGEKPNDCYYNSQ